MKVLKALHYLAVVSIIVWTASACEHKKGSPLGPSEYPPPDSRGAPTHLVLEVNRLPGQNRISVKMSGEPKLGLIEQPPIEITVMSATGVMVQTVNSIEFLRMYDYSCGERAYSEANFSSGTSANLTAGTYIEKDVCNRAEFQIAVRMHDRPQPYFHSLEHVEIRATNINARIVGDRIITDSWP